MNYTLKKLNYNLYIKNNIWRVQEYVRLKQNKHWFVKHHKKLINLNKHVIWIILMRMINKITIQWINRYKKAYWIQNN